LSSLGISELKPGMDKNLPVVGYIEKENAAKVERIFEKEGFRLVSTYNTVDQEGKYYALVAVKLTPAVIISHVQKTKAVNRSVEIYFNRVGAGKWADLTAKNTGRMVAFIIDNRVYCMPLVNARINNGVALITGLKDDTEAKQISEHLGNGI